MRVLARTPMFRGLDVAELADIDARAVALAWDAGEALYHQGAPAGHLFVVASGQAKVTRSTSEGREVVTDVVGPGDLVGAVRTFGGPVHEEGVTTLTTLCALRLSDEAFRGVLTAHPTVALRVLEDTTTLLAQARADVTRAGADVAERTAATLLRLADRFGEPGPDGGTLIEVPLSRADLAGLVGSTPESVSRVMSRWRSAGIIDSGRRWTAVLDPRRLREIAEPDGL